MRMMFRVSGSSGLDAGSRELIHSGIRPMFGQGFSGFKSGEDSPDKSEGTPRKSFKPTRRNDERVKPGTKKSLPPWQH